MVVIKKNTVEAVSSLETGANLTSYQLLVLQSQFNPQLNPQLSSFCCWEAPCFCVDRSMFLSSLSSVTDKANGLGGWGACTRKGELALQHWGPCLTCLRFVSLQLRYKDSTGTLTGRAGTQCWGGSHQLQVPGPDLDLQAGEQKTIRTSDQRERSLNAVSHFYLFWFFYKLLFLLFFKTMLFLVFVFTCSWQSFSPQSLFSDTCCSCTSDCK